MYVRLPSIPKTTNDLIWEAPSSRHTEACAIEHLSYVTTAITRLCLLQNTSPGAFSNHMKMLFIFIWGFNCFFVQTQMYIKTMTKMLS